MPQSSLELVRFLPPHVLLHTILHSDVLTLSKVFFFHLAAVLLHTLSIPHAHAVLHYCATGQEEHSMQLPTPSLLSVLTKLSEHTLILNISLLVSSSAVGKC